MLKIMAAKTLSFSNFAGVTLTKLCYPSTSELLTLKSIIIIS